MQTVIPQVLYEIITLIAELIRLIGMALVGVGIGYLAVDVLHKAEGWPMKAVGFLGLVAQALVAQAT